MMMDVGGLKMEIERLMQLQQEQQQANNTTSKRNISRIGMLLPPLHEYLVQVQLRVRIYMFYCAVQLTVISFTCELCKLENMV
jgi:hypothetical protein